MFAEDEGTMNATTMIRFARAESDWDRPVYTLTRDAQSPTARRSTAKTYSTQSATRIEKRRQRTRTFAEDPFRARFGLRLPSGMRQEARGMEWKQFISTYAPSPIRVEHLRANRLRAGRHEYQMSITGLNKEGCGTKVSITSMGASSAMTQILADHGYRVEILQFHQYDIFEATVTFIYTTHKSKRMWAVGFGANRDHSIANALCSAASRLYGL